MSGPYVVGHCSKFLLSRSDLIGRTEGAAGLTNIAFEKVSSRTNFRDL